MEKAAFSILSVWRRWQNGKSEIINYEMQMKSNLICSALIFQGNLPDGSKEDYSNLPPTQRRKKLTAKIQEIQQKIQTETAARDGLMKMKVVYEGNSLLGNPMSVEGQLNESENKLEKLKMELVKYQTYLEDADAKQQVQHSPQTMRSHSNSHSQAR